jgi:small subunit ribosomal protein S20
MANHYSALKRMRQSNKRAVQNRAHRTRLRHQVRELRRAIAAGDAAKVAPLVSQTVSLIDRNLKRGVIKENTAGRFKSRLMLRVAKLGKA